jgi:hypothetical protein
MPDNNIEWGQGGVNNNNDWGKAKANSTNNFGAVYDSSPSGDTNIAGGQPVVSITYSASTFCADASDPTPTIQNNAGVGTFSSTTGLVFISTTTGEVDIDASTVGSYLITYTDTDAATATYNFTINALPTVIVSTSAGTICNGESTTLTASGASTYVWNDGNTDNPRTVTPTTTTTFNATGTDSNGCTSSGGTTITVNALPTVEISGTLTYCVGSTATLTATAGLSSYLWSTGATTQAINVTAGSYTVTGTDSNGCSATSSASTVTELPLDVATVVYDSSAYCQMPTGATAVDGYYPLYSTASAANAVSSDGTNHTHVLGGVTYYMPNAGVIAYHGTYSLTTPAPTITGQSGTFSESTGNLSIDSSTGVITLNSSTAGTYTVVYTTNGTCPNTVNNTITVNALDGATFGYSASSLPQTGTASLTTTPTTSGGVYSAYPSGLSINSSTGEIDLANSTIQSYKVFYVTSAGCPNSSTFDLAVTAAGIANNYSMSFDGINDRLAPIQQPALDGVSAVSVSLWFNYNSVGGAKNMILTNGFGWYIHLSSATNLDYYNTSSNNITVSTSANTWYHLAIVHNGTSLEVWLNGTSLGTTTTNTPRNNIGQTLSVGAYRYLNGTFGYYWDGKLDEIGIWNTALTSTQVQEIYNAKGTNLTKDLTTVAGSNLKYWNRMGD